MKKTDNKGFSLVELIIVIAIMVILVAVIAPQYTKFVKNSKISSDINTAADISTAINVAFAEGNAVSYDSTNKKLVNVPNLPALPASKVDSSFEWGFTFDATSGELTKIELGGKEVWPTADTYKSANGYK